MKLLDRQRQIAGDRETKRERGRVSYSGMDMAANCYT